MSYGSGLDYPTQNSPLAPNLEFARGGIGRRYPNPFFDLGQQYMPTTIRELFQWCKFYFYSSPLIGPAIRKVSRYPITDLIFDDESESVRDTWSTIFVKYLRMKDRLMEINLDYHTYGNAFVSIHKPFTRFLSCKVCGHSAQIKNWKWNYRFSVYAFSGQCPTCKAERELDVKDVGYKDIKKVSLIRWNPENIHIKFNEYTNEYLYFYRIPAKIKRAVERNDKDIIAGLPLIVLEAIKHNKMIKFNQNNLKHLKAPSLAEEDQGWGKPTMLHVLKDMYYFNTLRRAQEAIANEHILPFDVIYPLPNGQQDPFMHVDLGGWRNQIADQIERHRRDPNYKAILPIPVGTARIGGDGKALMLNPEMQYITQTVVGGLGLQSDFLFGGMQWTGSSISLRMLENDFVQNRSQMEDLVHWVKEDLRIWNNYPNLDRIRFADFRMADDVQRNQQLIGMNAQGKVSDQTLLTELGYDYDQEIKKKIEEVYIANYIGDMQAKGAAETQGEASIIQTNYQQKVQELAASAQQRMQAMGMGGAVGPDGQPQQAQSGQQAALPPAQGGGQPPDQGGEPSGGQGQGAEWPQAGAAPGGVAGAPAVSGAADGGSPAAAGDQPPGAEDQVAQFAQKWARQLVKMTPTQARLVLTQLKTKFPQLAKPVEDIYNQMMAGQGGATGAVSTQPSMKPLPERGGSARRSEVTGAGSL